MERGQWRGGGQNPRLGYGFGSKMLIASLLKSHQDKANKESLTHLITSMDVELCNKESKSKEIDVNSNQAPFGSINNRNQYSV